MDELISKRAVIEAIEKARANVGHNLERSIGKSIIEILDDVGRDIDRLPSVEPKRGKWIKTARWGRVYYCDQCRNYLDFDGVNAGRGSTNFCPNCGCRMDGGE